MPWILDHGLAVAVGAGSVLLVLISGPSGTLFGGLSAATAHHYAHIALPTTAFVIFSGGIVKDIRRNGWPAFSWRLQSRER